MRYYHAALNPVVSSRAQSVARPSAASPRASMPARIFWKIVFAAFVAAVAFYVWRQR